MHFINLKMIVYTGTIILFILYAEVSSVSVQHKVSQETLNTFVDAAFRHLRKSVKNKSLEPISVSDAGPFSSNFFTGLGNIYRYGDAMVIDQMGSNRTIATLALLRGSANLSFSCDIRVLGSNICDNGADLRFKGFKIYLVLRPQSGHDALPQLDICDVNDLGRTSVNFNKSGVFGSIISWMGTWFSTLIKSSVADNLENALCKVIASNL